MHHLAQGGRGPEGINAMRYDVWRPNGTRKPRSDPPERAHALTGMQSLLPALAQRQQGEAGAVRLVVVVERIVPPRAVLLLERQHQVGEVVLVERPLLGLELLDAQAGVVVPEVVEVAGDLEWGLVRHRALAAVGQPAVADD